MKLSDYVAEFLVNQNVGHVFGITGGVIAHIFDSLGKNNNIKYICPQHEQAAAMAADGYAKISNNLGVSIATSGPGATNLLTGVCCSYFDSVPTLAITGQVQKSQLKGSNKSRQVGFQETDIVSIFKPVTKYSKLILDSLQIKYELEKACHIAKSGRPGPVLLDIPDDLQRANINPSKLVGYLFKEKNISLNKLEDKIDSALSLLSNAKRPVLILGSGVMAAKDKIYSIVEKLGLPVLLTWGAIDLLPDNYPLLVRDFGVTSNRAGNFTVQNSDLLFAIGTRLDTHETGNNIGTFARESKRIVVDIDSEEINKYARQNFRVDVPINFNTVDFCNILDKKLNTFSSKDYHSWFEKINEWKKKYPICISDYSLSKKLNPYLFMKALSEASSEEDIIITDTGCTVTWTYQGFKIKKNQRLLTSFNHSPMGYSLPASIGAHYASGKSITCLTGDGGIQMNIQELATIAKNNLPLKIFVMNNQGYGMIRQTQDIWLDKRHEASSLECGIAIPDFCQIANAYGIKSETITMKDNLESKLKKVLSNPGPILCNIAIDPSFYIIPKLTFGEPIEDLAPLLTREEFLDNMLIKPLEISLKNKK